MGGADSRLRRDIGVPIDGLSRAVGSDKSDAVSRAVGSDKSDAIERPGSRVVDRVSLPMFRVFGGRLRRAARERVGV